LSYRIFSELVQDNHQDKPELAAIRIPFLISGKKDLHRRIQVNAGSDRWSPAGAQTLDINYLNLTV
jgi:hypothetical protein